MGSQIGCGRVCFAQEPKAMRDKGLPDCANVAEGTSDAAPATGRAPVELAQDA